VRELLNKLFCVSVGAALILPAGFAAKAALPPPSPLPEDDIFAPYVDTVPIVTTVLSEAVQDGIKVTHLRFASFEGSKEGVVNGSEVYAVMARPAAPAVEKRPGILICHGGGGMAGAGGPIAWAKYGYVAIAPDIPGYGANDKMKSISRVTTMPYGSDQITVTPSPYACVLFDAGVASLGAFNLLASQEDVDPDQLCVTGISWGGYMTTMLAGLLGERVAAAFNLYGSGFYQIDAIGSDQLQKMPEDERNTWIRSFDAATRLSRARAAFLMYSAANDIFFKPPSTMATFNAIPGSKYFCFGPNKNHWITLPGGPIAWEIPITTEVEPVYFAHILAGNTPPLPTLHATAVPRAGNTLSFTVDDVPADARGWFYVSWIPTPERRWPERDWARIEAVRGNDGAFTCVIPDTLGSFDWFGGITFTLTSGQLQSPMSLSTGIYRCQAGE